MKSISEYADEFYNFDFFEKDVSSLSQEISEHIFNNCMFLRFYEDEDRKQVLYADGYYFLYMEVNGLKLPNIIMVTKNLDELETKCKTKFIQKNISKLPCFYDLLKPELQNKLGDIAQEHFEWITTIDAKCSLPLFDIFNHTQLQTEKANEYNKIVFDNRLKFLRFYNLGIERFQKYNSVKTERVTPIVHKLIVNGNYKGNIEKRNNKEYVFEEKKFYSFKSIKDWARLRKNIH